MSNQDPHDRLLKPPTGSRPLEALDWSKLVELLRLEQTLFALPFALLAAIWASGGWPELATTFWIVVAMVGARTAGMSANRLIDARLDGRNPRTKGRLLPSGRLKPGPVLLLLGLSLATLLGAAEQLNPLCFQLAPIAVGLLLLYSYLKRWTWGCHFGLGAVQACGPLGAWIACRGTVDPPVVWLAAGVFLWMAGFDILYALADEEHDRNHGIRSVPARFGAQRACEISRACHLGAFLSWLVFGSLCHGGAWWAAGLGAVGSLLVWEHILVGPGKLERLPLAFFKVNSAIAAVLLLATIGEHL